MSFTTLEYLLFLPFVFLLYWFLPRHQKNIQNMILVCASLFFYAWSDWRFVGLLLLTALTTFMSGLLLQRNSMQEHKRRKCILVSTLLFNVGILFFFKYCNFFIQAFADAFTLFGKEIQISTLNIILPIGISFYTFTALSYTIDVYQRKISPTKDLLAYLAYVMFFPSILSGPISRAQKQLPQYFYRRSFIYANVIAGCKDMLMGGVMKLCLADRLGIYVDAVYGNISQHNGTTLLFTSILYTIQIYADFAGYSLMAIGSGKLFGIDLPTNFVRPYFAKTVTEFWRRWHISLTTWFRDYIYFPLGGNRVSKLRWMLNTMVVFLVSGLWHGAAYTFLIWGALHGICMIVERQIYGPRIKEIRNKITLTNMLRIAITFMVVSFAWIFFRAPTLTDAMTIIEKIFSDCGRLFIDMDTLVYSFLFMALIFAVDFADEYAGNRIRLLNSQSVVVRWGSYLFMIVMILLFGVLDGGSFIYFQF